MSVAEIRIELRTFTNYLHLLYRSTFSIPRVLQSLSRRARGIIIILILRMIGLKYRTKRQAQTSKLQVLIITQRRNWEPWLLCTNYLHLFYRSTFSIPRLLQSLSFFSCRKYLQGMKQREEEFAAIILIFCA
jgi:hypothetical protein